LNHRPQGDEFLEIILQDPPRPSENYLLFDKTTERRDCKLYHIAPLSLLWLVLQGPLQQTTITMSSDLALHGTLLTGLGRKDLEEIKDDVKSSPFPKLRSRWLLIIFYPKLHLELHLFVEWTMAITEA